MERISNTIDKIYQKYLPIAKKLGVSLDIDFPDTALKFENKTRIEKDLDKNLKAAISRARGGHVVISVRPSKIVVKDSGLPLTKTACLGLTTEKISVKSRVGFGTTVTIQD